jgi:hypothetical protein
MKWRISPTGDEIAIIELVMGGNPLQKEYSDFGKIVPSSGNKKSDDYKRDMEAAETRLMKQFALAADDIVMTTRIGAGSFGEVFKGKVHGAPVAIKVMLSITEKSVREFRAEIILTASLR